MSLLDRYRALQKFNDDNGIFIKWWESRAVIGFGAAIVAVFAHIWWIVVVGIILGVFSAYKVRQKRQRQIT